METDNDTATFNAPAEEFAQPEAVDDATGADDILPQSPAAPVVANEADEFMDEDPVSEAIEEDADKTGKKKTKQPPVKDAFTPWEPTITHPPKNDFWGIKPVTGDPRPHPDQPSARNSDAATNPPMWEDRNYRFKRGSRYVKYFGPIKPEGADGGPDLDQEDLLVMKLIDMRPKNRYDQSPRRTPMSYFFEAGKPKDWNSMQAIKALNDRRGQAIDRVTVDAPWSKIEREYLSALLNEHPDASIWELTERHNDRFMGKDYIGASGFTYTEFSPGRTVESVRHEYMTYKPAYDAGEPPKNVRWRTDKSVAGKELRKRNANKTEQSFGKPDKKLEKEFDEAADEGEEDGSGDESDGEGKKKTPKSKPQKKITVKKRPKKSPTKKSKAKIEDSDNEGELQKQASQKMAAQPKLNEDDEALLDLAGINNPEELRNFPPCVPSSTPPRRTLSWSSGSDISDVPADTSSQQAQPLGLGSAKSRVASLADATKASPYVKSPSAVDFEAAVVAMSHEAVADVIETHRPKSANASVHQSSEPEVVVPEQVVVQQSVTVEHRSRVATPDRSSTTPTRASKTPSPKAAREIDIDENYDDEEL